MNDANAMRYKQCSSIRMKTGLRCHIPRRPNIFKCSSRSDYRGIKSVKILITSEFSGETDQAGRAIDRDLLFLKCLLVPASRINKIKAIRTGSVA